MFTSDDAYLESLWATEPIVEEYSEKELEDIDLALEYIDKTSNLLEGVNVILENHKNWHAINLIMSVRHDLRSVVRELKNID